jgi:hypothetical protein
MFTSILAAMMSPNLSHVVFAVAGAGLAWWAKKHPPAPTPTLPDVVPERHVSLIESLLSDPALLAVVQLLKDRLLAQQAVAAHDALQTLAVPVAVPVAAPVVVTPPAK